MRGKMLIRKEDTPLDTRDSVLFFPRFLGNTHHTGKSTGVSTWTAWSGVDVDDDAIDV